MRNLKRIQHAAAGVADAAGGHAGYAALCTRPGMTL